MKITLLRHYQNMRGQTLTAHKEYNATDPALGGLASHLIENGYAYISEKDAPKPAPVIEPLAVDLDETGELEASEELEGFDFAEDEPDFTVESVIEDESTEDEPAPKSKRKK
jgi:hypothetical protein